MRNIVLRIIVIELCSTGCFPLEEESEYFFHSVKVLLLMLLFSLF
jgi:hypothetical protein